MGGALSDQLRYLLKFYNCFSSGSGKVYGYCPKCQSREDSPNSYRLTLTPGKKYPLILSCFHCLVTADKRRKRWFFFEVLREAGVESEELAQPATEEEIRKVWSESGVGKATERKLDYLPADPDLLHEVYSELLDGLDLNRRHSKWLEKRGLNSDLAFALGYRSTPEDATELSKKLFQKWGFRLGLVPGFSNVFSEEFAQLCTRPEAVLTPCRDWQGRVLALKMRMLDGGPGRMRLLAGGSSKPAVLCHVPLGVGGEKKWEEIWVTEGERKADIHFQRTGRPTLGIPGTGCWSCVVPVITPSCSSRSLITLALDQDRKPQTLKAQEKLGETLTGLGYRVCIAEWEGAKGIDDTVVKGVEIRVKEWEKEGSVGFGDQTTTSLHSTVDLDTGKPPIPNSPLTDREILPFVAKWGPIARSELPLRHPNQQVLLSRWIWSGKLKVVDKNSKGQVLEVAK